MESKKLTVKVNTWTHIDWDKVIYGKMEGVRPLSCKKCGDKHFLAGCKTKDL